MNISNSRDISVGQFSPVFSTESNYKSWAQRLEQPYDNSKK